MEEVDVSLETSSTKIDQGLEIDVNDYLSHIACMPEGNLAGITRRGHLGESNALKSLNEARNNHQADLFSSNSFLVAIGISPEQQAHFDPTERHLLIHYVQYVSRAFVVVDDDENPFLEEVLQLAQEVKSVRHAMLALTACHLCKVYPIFEDTLILQHSLALHHLKLDLESGDRIPYALVTSLLLCLFGVGQPPGFAFF
jgi:transcriptional activator protein UGA3